MFHSFPVLWFTAAFIDTCFRLINCSAKGLPFVWFVSNIGYYTSLALPLIVYTISVHLLHASQIATNVKIKFMIVQIYSTDASLCQLIDMVIEQKPMIGANGYELTVNFLVSMYGASIPCAVLIRDLFNLNE